MERNIIPNEEKNKTKQKAKLKDADVLLTDVTVNMSSVKLTKTAGGEIRPEVKIYDVDPERAEDMAIKIMDRLNKKYR